MTKRCRCGGHYLPLKKDRLPLLSACNLCHQQVDGQSLVPAELRQSEGDPFEDSNRSPVWWPAPGNAGWRGVRGLGNQGCGPRNKRRTQRNAAPYEGETTE